MLRQTSKQKLSQSYAEQTATLLVPPAGTAPPYTQVPRFTCTEARFLKHQLYS